MHLLISASYGIANAMRTPCSNCEITRWSSRVFSVGFLHPALFTVRFIDAVATLRGLLSRSAVDAEAISQIGVTMKRLETVIEMFAQLEQLTSYYKIYGETDRAESLTALIYSASLTLDGFRERLTLKCEQMSIRPSSERSVTDECSHLMAEREIQNLDLYLMGQAMVISNVLRMWT